MALRRGLASLVGQAGALPCLANALQRGFAAASSEKFTVEVGPASVSAAPAADRWSRCSKGFIACDICCAGHAVQGAPHRATQQRGGDEH